LCHVLCLSFLKKKRAEEGELPGPLLSAPPRAGF
jgi:hypothetical protein